MIVQSGIAGAGAILAGSIPCVMALGQGSVAWLLEYRACC